MSEEECQYSRYLEVIGMFDVRKILLIRNRAEKCRISQRYSFPRLSADIFLYRKDYLRWKNACFPERLNRMIYSI